MKIIFIIIGTNKEVFVANTNYSETFFLILQYFFCTWQAFVFHHMAVFCVFHDHIVAYFSFFSLEGI